MSAFKNNTDLSKNLLQIMSDHEERDCIAVIAEMKKRFERNVARSTVFYYFEALAVNGKMRIKKVKSSPGLGRPKTTFKMVA